MTKRKKILAAVFLGLNLLLLFTALLYASHLRSLLLSQGAAEVWRGQSEDRFAQVSCFFPVNEAIDENTVFYFRRSLESKLVEASLQAPENGSLWTDAYSAFGTLNVSSDRASSEANAIGVGGDFFLFHPLSLLYGSFFDSENVMDDLVVIDRELAWKLYGGSDVCGMTLTIGADSYIVVGVIDREADFASSAAYPGGAGIYMSYSAFYKNLPSAGISCYEIVLPDPVTGFALGIMEGGFTSAAEVIQNTGRFDFSNNLELLRQFGKRSMRTGGMAYPYWENASRLVEDYLALLAVFTLILCLYPLLTVLYLLKRFSKYLRRRFKDLRGAAERYGEKRRTRGYIPAGPGIGDCDAYLDAAENPAYLGTGEDFTDAEAEFDLASIVREILEEDDI